VVCQRRPVPFERNPAKTMIHYRKLPNHRQSDSLKKRSLVSIRVVGLFLWTFGFSHFAISAQPSDISTKEPDACASESEFSTLLTEHSLDGWTPRGGTSEFQIREGTLVGTCVEGSPSTYLCTEAIYKDFILELEFNADPSMNSGIQIRTQIAGKDTKYLKTNGKTRTLKKGAVYGYQVEIDPTDRQWSGGIYDQSRRGWLQTLEANPKAREAYKKDSWNHFRIRCQGNRIQTWINGVPAADFKDDVDVEGVIGLQIHGAGKHKDRIGAHARFRNIRLKKLN
jgi:hypothetical protein